MNEAEILPDAFIDKMQDLWQKILKEENKKNKEAKTAQV